MSNEEYNELLKRVDALVRKQEELTREIQLLRHNIKDTEPVKDKKTQKITHHPVQILAEQDVQSQDIPKMKRNLEEFIGGNLSGKIGILAVIAGIGISISYAIEKNLLGVSARIIVAIISGFILIGIAARMVKKYRSFSAILFSGGVAILYFSVFLANNLYQLIPVWLTFVLMVLLTVATAMVALWQNNEAIGLYGFVGAYAIPFLLGIHEQKNMAFLTYILIINCGILFLAWSKYWKTLYYSSFGITWLIFLIWYINFGNHLSESLIFILSSAFFLLFYGVFLLYKFKKGEIFIAGDVIVLLLNSFVFYGIGFSLLRQNDQSVYSGIYTFSLAVVHGIAAFLIHRNSKADHPVFLLVAGLFITFFTIAIPVQLSGNWVPLIWGGELCFLFYIARRTGTKFYAVISEILAVLTLSSLVVIWVQVFQPFDFPDYSGTPVIFNAALPVSLFVILAFVIVNRMQSKLTDPEKIIPEWIFPLLLFSVVYFFIRLEIGNFFALKHHNSMIPDDPDNLYDDKYIYLKRIWMYAFSSVYLFLIVRFYNPGKSGATVLLSLILFFMLVHFIFNIPVLNNLADLYYNSVNSTYYSRGQFLLLVRYIPVLSFSLLLISYFKILKEVIDQKVVRSVLLLIFHALIIALISTEWYYFLIMAYGKPAMAFSFRIGLSIIWALYSVGLLLSGIKHKTKLLRVSGITWLGITMIKVVFFDLSQLETLGRTVVLVVVGIILLTASFLYQKYKPHM